MLTSIFTCIIEKSYEGNSNILEQINKAALKLLAAQKLDKLCAVIVEEGKKLVGAEYGSIFYLVPIKISWNLFTVLHLFLISPK